MHDGHGWRDESDVEFVEATRDRVWSLTVRTQRGVVGHIFRAANGEYAYSPGPFNAFTALFTDRDLERVKERVQHRDRSVTIRWTFRVRTAHDIFGFADGRTLRPKGDTEDLASVSIVFDHQHRET